jgi:hypothetical protein
MKKQEEEEEEEEEEGEEEEKNDNPYVKQLESLGKMVGKKRC